MITEIGNIIISKIETLPFLDKYAGVVKTLTMVDTSNNTNQRKTFPVSCNASFEECSSGRYKDLCPDSKKKSVLYLEDNGLRILRTEGTRTYWKASFNLVCWLNLPLLGQSTCSYSAIVIMAIIKKLPVVPFNSNDTYSQVKINVIGQQPKSTNPFARYTYDEAITQFLMYPYDHFVLAIDVDFMVDSRCMTIPELNPQINCLKK